MKSFSFESRLHAKRKILSLTTVFIFILLTGLCYAQELQITDYRFAQKYSVEEVINNPEKAESFLKEYLHREAKYYAIARNSVTGITYDGINLDEKTGLPAGVRDWSAPSKECLDIGVLVKALYKNPYASIVVSPDNPGKAPEVAASILEKKLRSYNDFNRRFPGYGGFLPWFHCSGGIEPLKSWKGHVPGLDNGEWLWSMLLAEKALRDNGFDKLADEYGKYNEMLNKNAVKIFYDEKAGKVRGDVGISDIYSPDAKYSTLVKVPGRASYLTGSHGINEGTMLLLYLTLFCKDLPSDASDKIWSGIHLKRIEHKFGTTWQGAWGSAHESWIFLFLPLREISQYNNLFRIREEIRSQNAAERKYPGFATSAISPDNKGYLDGAGIEGVGEMGIKNNHIYTIYGVFPMLMEFSGDKLHEKNNIALAWLLNMLKGDRIQGPLGAAESGTNDGRHVAYVKTIDGSLTNILALCGGLEKETSQLLQEKKLSDKFNGIMVKKYEEAFGKEPLTEKYGFALPSVPVPTGFMKEFVPESVENELRAKTVFSGEDFLKKTNLVEIEYLFDSYYRKGRSLDGKWKVLRCYDGNGLEIEGRKMGPGEITVPGHWLTQGYFDVTGMDLQKKFRMGDRQPGKRFVLHFGGVIYTAEVRLNGKLLKTLKGVTKHEGYFTPFEYDITDQLIYNGENTLEVAVHNNNEKPDNDLNTKNGGTGFPHWGANKRDIMGVLDFHDTKPGTASHQKYNVGGIWLPVRIFKADETARILPNPMVNTTLAKKADYSEKDFDRRDAQMNFSIPVMNFTNRNVKAKLQVKIYPYNFSGIVSDEAAIDIPVSLKPGRNDIEAACVMEQAKLWQPWFLGKPAMYSARVTILSDNKPADTAMMRFGVREMTGDVRGKWFINGRLLRIMGDNIIPSLTPGTYTKADSIRDGKLVIDANVQLLRVHAHMPHPYFHEMADNMGIILWQDFPQQWLSPWDEEYNREVFRQMKEMAQMTISHPSVILLNVHNENTYFDGLNAYKLPQLPRGIWMHLSKFSRQQDFIGAKIIRKFYEKHLGKELTIKPEPSVFINAETGAEWHPYYGYYYGEGLFDNWFLPTPHKVGVYPEYDPFSLSWGWREEGHNDPGVGAVPTTSYERCAGGGGMNEFGPDEFGFQSLYKKAAELALRDVLKEEYPEKSKMEMADLVSSKINTLPWGYLFDLGKLWGKAEKNEEDKLFIKVLDKLQEHCFQSFGFSTWLRPEKPLEQYSLDDVVKIQQEYQAWGIQVTAENYRRAGYGQTRFMFMASEDDSNMLYSVDWALVTSDRKPKKAFKNLQNAYSPVLLSTGNLSRKLMPGENWMKGLWLHNNTQAQLGVLTAKIILADASGKVKRQFAIPDVYIAGFAIRDMKGSVPGDFIVSEKETPAGKYTLTLSLTDEKGRKISENTYDLEVLPVDLTEGLDEATRENVEKILAGRLNPLQKYFDEELKLSISDSDDWDDIVERLVKSRKENWQTWKKTIEQNPECLLDYPEFTDNIRELINAKYPYDRAKQDLQKLKNNKAAPEKIAELEKKAETLKENYEQTLAKTKQTLNLTEKDFAILTGEKGARIPIPLFYGKEMTNDAWFVSLIKELEDAGANEAAMKVRKYWNTKTGHWFDREVKVLRVLRVLRRESK